MMNRKRLKSPKQKPDAVSIVIGILLSVYVLGLLVPTIWAALTAFMDVKSYQQAYLFSNFEGGKFPFQFTMENFVIANDFLEVQAVNTGEFWYVDSMYINSLKFALFSAVSFTVCCTLVSYLTAKFDFKFSKIIYGFVIVAMSLPIVGSMPSEIKMAQATGVMNKIWGLWIMRANFLGLYFLVFYDVCKALPASFSEAAKIDGANNFQIFFQIAMPLIKNTFMTILLIKFISFWNDYQAAMVFMPSYPTVAIGLNRIMNINADSTRYNHKMVPARMAAVVMTATPVCILFAIFQKRLLGNLTVGGVKG